MRFERQEQQKQKTKPKQTKYLGHRLYPISGSFDLNFLMNSASSLPVSEFVAVSDSQRISFFNCELTLLFSCEILFNMFTVRTRESPHHLKAGH